MGKSRKAFLEKNKHSSLYYRKLHGDSWYSFYYNTLSVWAYQLFEWKGLPKTINPFFLEKTLQTTGRVCFYNDKRYGAIAVKGTETGVNMYDEPLRFKASMIEYTKSFDLKTYTESIEEAKEKRHGIIAYNQFGSDMPSTTIIAKFAAMLAENKQTFLVAQNSLKAPYVFSGTEEQVLAIKNFFNKVTSNEPLIITEEDEDLAKKFQVLNTNVKFILNEIYANRNEITNEFLTNFGVNNLNINKRERSVVSEVNANNEMIMNYRNKFLVPRKELALLGSELFDEEITVDIRTDVLSLGDSGGDENGTIHTDNS